MFRYLTLIKLKDVQFPATKFVQRSYCHVMGFFLGLILGHKKTNVLFWEGVFWSPVLQSLRRFGVLFVWLFITVADWERWLSSVAQFPAGCESIKVWICEGTNETPCFVSRYWCFMPDVDCFSWGFFPSEVAVTVMADLETFVTARRMYFWCRRVVSLTKTTVWHRGLWRSL